MDNNIICNTRGSVIMVIACIIITVLFTLTLTVSEMLRILYTSRRLNIIKSIVVA